MPFAFDEWGVDVAVTASQKCLMSSPGLAWVVLSERAWTACESSRLPRNYWDFAAVKRAVGKARPETPGTPPVQIVLQVAEALRMIHEEGLDAVYARHARAGARVREGSRELGLSLQCPELLRLSATMTAIALPAGVEPRAVARSNQGARHSHRRRARSVRVDGFRIGHMGDIRMADVERTLDALRHSLDEVRANAAGAPRRVAVRTGRRVVRLERKILLGFGAGVGVGLLARAPGMASFAAVVSYLEPVGTVFIRLITMVVVPLVIASVFVGVASLGDVRSLGRVGGKTLIFFLGTTLVAAIIGLLVATTANVGAGLSIPSQDAATAQAAGATTPAVPGVVQMLVNMIPQNPFAAAAQGGADLLPLIIAVCIFGAAATVVGAERRQPVVRFFEGVNEMAMVVIGWLMRLAPFGVFVLIAATVARSGLGLLDQLLAFGAVVIVALLAARRRRAAAGAAARRAAARSASFSARRPTRSSSRSRRRRRTRRFP